jgi:quercetin dioxygenase-like cupin family protein
MRPASGNAERQDRDDEAEGGDPPCWAHLFEEWAVPCEDPEDVGDRASETTGSGAAGRDPVDLAGLVRSTGARGPIWTYQGEDLNVNLLVFAAGGGMAEHVNAEVDVLLVGVAGEGAVEIDGRRHALRAGQALVVPKGARRAIRALGDRFAYLTCHRRRAGLWPAVMGRRPGNGTSGRAR